MQEMAWLKEFRINKDKTQADVAKEAEISRAFYTEIETGAKNPSPTTAMKIAKVLGFNWTLFFEKKSGETQQAKYA